MLPLTLLQSLAAWIAPSPRRRTSRLRHRARPAVRVDQREERVLLSAAPAIVSLELLNDTGTPGDNVTTDATLTGSVSNDGPVDNLTIEFDYDGDGTADQVTYTDMLGEFTYDVGADLSYGEHTVRARAVEWYANVGQNVYGAWVSVTFDYQPPPNDPAEVHNLQVDSSGILTGYATNDGYVDGLTIELDYDGDGVAEQTTYTDMMGNFSRDVGADLGYGQHTVAARAVEWYANVGQNVYGAWVSVTFDHQPPPNDPAEVHNLQVDAAGILTGYATNDEYVDGLTIELDYDGDGIAEQTTYTDMMGHFSRDVGADLGYGQHTVRVRAVEWDSNTGQNVYGAWVSITFDHQPPPNVAPLITSFVAWRQSGNIWVFQGHVDDEDPGSLIITFGGLLAGHSVMVMPNGAFEYYLEIPPDQQGQVTAQTTDSGGLQSNIMYEFVS